MHSRHRLDACPRWKSRRESWSCMLPCTPARPVTGRTATHSHQRVWLPVGAAGPAAVDEEFILNSRAAGTAFGKARMHGQLTSTDRRWNAYTRDDREAIVDTQCNLAVVLLRLGSLEEARAVVDDAKAELSRAEQEVPAHLLLLEATVLYRTGQTAAAWDISEQLLAGAAEAGVWRHGQGPVFARPDGCRAG